MKKCNCKPFLLHRELDYELGNLMIGQYNRQFINQEKSFFKQLLVIRRTCRFFGVRSRPRLKNVSCGILLIQFTQMHFHACSRKPEAL